MKPLDAALSYAERRWLVFPIRQGGKTPATANGFKDATRDPEVIRQWYSGRSGWEKRNIGIVCGEDSAMWALDCDIDKETGELGEDTLADLEKEFGVLPPHPVQKTPSGGKHHVFAWPDDGKGVPRRIRFRANLDALGSGGYLLIAPSHTAGFYEWIVSPDECPPPQAPSWLLQMIREGKRGRPEDMPHIAPVTSKDTTAYGRKTLDDICAEIASAPITQQDVILRDRSTRIGSLAYGGDIELNEAFSRVIDAGMQMKNQSGRDPWTRQVIEKKVRKFFDHASKSPTPRHDPAPKRTRPQLVVSNQEKPKEKEKTVPEPEDWSRDLNFIWNDDGTKLKPSPIRNTQLMIEFCPDTAGMFILDAFADRILMTRGLPGDPRRNYPRQLNDHDETALASWLNTKGLTPPVAMVAAVIREVASRHDFDPLCDYLNGLNWDGEERLGNWLITYAGAADTDYNRLIGKKALISAVARALMPGCKVDTMLILEGPQGLLKSTLARLLCGAAFFTDQVGDVTSKDSSERLLGAWFVEIPEMDKFSRAEANAVKDFVSRLDDRYRPSYGRNVIIRPRRCIFFGTINPNGVGYLKDTTGNRRFWPTKVTKINRDAIVADRDQLWAEAVHCFLEGEEWWISDADIKTVLPEQEKRRDDDVWEPKIAEWLDKNEGWRWVEARQKWIKAFTTSQVLTEAIGLELKFQKQSEKIRIAKILDLLGCTDEQHKNEIRGRSWECIRR